MIDNASLIRSALAYQRIFGASGGGSVNADDLPLGPIHDRDQRKRVGVEIRIRVVLPGVDGENEALEVPSVFVRGVEAAVRPGLDDDFEAFGESELFDFVLKQG